MKLFKRFAIAMATLGMLATSASATTPPSYGSNTDYTLDTSVTVQEASGVVSSGDHTGVLWVIEDSGNATKVRAYDYSSPSTTGDLLATITLTGLGYTTQTGGHDWEDIAIYRKAGATDKIVVFDIGDNGNDRGESGGGPKVNLIVFDEPDAASGDASVAPTVYEFKYYDSSDVQRGGTNYSAANAEAGVVDTDSGTSVPLIILKDSSSGRTGFQIYKLPAMGTISSSVTNHAIELTSTIAGWSGTGPEQVVAADISADRTWFVLRNGVEALLWERDGSWGNTFETHPDYTASTSAVGNGKWEGIGFARTTYSLWQVKDLPGDQSLLRKTACTANC